MGYPEFKSRGYYVYAISLNVLSVVEHYHPLPLPSNVQLSMVHFY